MQKQSISVLIWLLGFLVADTYAQGEDSRELEDVDPVTAVTLWQFGAGRLAGGQSTLALIPLGTALGGVETTYLYQAANPVVVMTTNDDGVVSVVGTRVSTAPRTVIAFASGWFEVFDNEPTQTGHIIACSLVNSGFGNCIDITGASTVTSNSGLPTPEVFQVALTAVTPTSSVASTVPPTRAVLTGPPTPTSSAFSSASAPTSKTSSARTGPIVGGVVGGFGVLGTIVALCVLCRRRRRKLSMVEDAIMPRAFTTHGASAPGPDAHTGIWGVNTREYFAPQSLAAPFPAKGAIGPSSDPLVAGDNAPAEGASGLTTLELARMVYERVYGHHQVQEDELPPSYSDFANGS